MSISWPMPRTLSEWAAPTLQILRDDQRVPAAAERRDRSRDERGEDPGEQHAAEELAALETERPGGLLEVGRQRADPGEEIEEQIPDHPRHEHQDRGPVPAEIRDENEDDHREQRGRGERGDHLDQRVARRERRRDGERCRSRAEARSRGRCAYAAVTRRVEAPIASGSSKIWCAHRPRDRSRNRCDTPPLPSRSGSARRRPGSTRARQ